MGTELVGETDKLYLHSNIAKIITIVIKQQKWDIIKNIKLQYNTKHCNDVILQNYWYKILYKYHGRKTCVQYDRDSISAVET